MSHVALIIKSIHDLLFFCCGKWKPVSISVSESEYTYILYDMYLCIYVYIFIY